MNRSGGVKLNNMISVILALLFLSPLADTNWPQFRGPAAGGIGTGAPPQEWNADSGKNIRWKAEIPGLGHSSPVIWGDRIFLTSAVGAGDAALKVGLYGDIAPVKSEGEQSFRVYCVDRKTGKILWSALPSASSRKSCAIPNPRTPIPRRPPMGNIWWSSLDPKGCSPTI